MTIEGIFKKFGTAKALGEAIGRNAIRASEMKSRRSIPVKYWPALVDAAKARGIDDLTYETLVDAHTAPADSQEDAA